VLRILALDRSDPTEVGSMVEAVDVAEDAGSSCMKPHDIGSDHPHHPKPRVSLEDDVDLGCM